MSTEEETNPYELLGITLEATEAEIRTAYRQRSLKVHPDRVSVHHMSTVFIEDLIQGNELLESRQSRCRYVAAEPLSLMHAQTVHSYQLVYSMSLTRHTSCCSIRSDAWRWMRRCG